MFCQTSGGSAANLRCISTLAPAVKILRRAFRPWSFWLFLISVPLSYVSFVVFLTVAVLATVENPEWNDIAPSLYGFSIYWVVGCYLFIPGCWVTMSFLGMGVRRWGRFGEHGVR